MTNLGITARGETVDPKCTDRGFLIGTVIFGGVVCYNRTTAVSTAVYICNDGYNLVGNEARVCQSDGSWSGSTPQCIPEEGGMCCSQLHNQGFCTCMV